MLTALRRLLRQRRSGTPIIIVSGLPRSGTSMMMKMLQAGGLELVTDRLRTADDDNPKGYFEDERVKQLDKESDKEWLADARGKVLKVISQLLRDLPPRFNYQVVFMNRDLHEVIASQNKMLKNRGEYTDSEQDQEMAKLFDQHLWIAKKWLARQSNMEVLEVSYAKVLEDPGHEAERIARFLGLESGKVRLMAEMVDPRLYRNRATELPARKV